MSKYKIVIASMGAVAMLAFAAFAGAETGSMPKGSDSENMSAARMSVQINASGHAELSGTIAAVQANSFTVNSWGGVWTVNVGSNAKLARRFGGNSNLGEFAAGDVVSVSGTANKTAAWTIDAKVVRNMSIQVRNANFSGTISALSGSNFTFSTKERGNVSVSVNADARVMVNGTSSSVANLANGMSANVSGVWNRAQSSVMASRVNARTPKVSNSSSTDR